MNFKTTLILIALLAVVGGYWLLFEQGRSITPADDAPADEAGEALLAESFSAAAVNRITVERDGDKVVLEREGDGWMQVEPVRFPLQSSAINELLTQARDLRYMQQFAAGTSDGPTLKSASLDPPRATVRLKSDDRTLTLTLGDRYAGGMAYLTRGDQNQIYTVPRAFHDAVLDKTVRDWRQTSLAGPKATGTQRIELANEHGRMTLTKRDGRWYLDESQRADSDAVKSLADAVRNASIETFTADRPEDLSLYGLASPRITLSLQAPSPATGPAAGSANQENGDATQRSNMTSLRIGSATELTDEPSAYFATWTRGSDGRGEHVVFELSRSTVASLKKAPADLREPRMVTASTDEVTRLRVTRRGQTDIDLIRDGEVGFRFGEPAPGFAADTPTARSLIETITTAEATGYAPDFKPAGEPVATIALTHRGSGHVERVRLHEASAATTQPSNASAGDTAATQPKDKATYLAVRNNEPVAYRISADDLGSLLEPILALRKKAVVDLDPAELRSLELRRDDGVVFDFRRQTSDRAATQPSGSDGSSAAAAWQLAGQQAFERDAFASLLQAMQPLRINAWRHEPVSIGDNAITLRWTTTGGDTHTLRVASESGEATLTGLDPGFVVPDGLVTKLKAEYRERTVLPLKTEALEQLVVIDGEDDQQTTASVEALRSSLAAYDPAAPPDRGLRITRDESDQFVTDGEASINQSAAGAIFDRLAGLEVKRYIEPSEIRSITRRLRATTQGGETFELVLLDDGTAWLHGELPGRPVSRWFTLRQSTIDDLTREVTGSAATGQRQPPMPRQPGQGRGMPNIPQPPGSSR